MGEINLPGSDETVARSPLETELQTFESLLPTLLETNHGDWALIKDTELGDVLPDENAAISKGYELYGNLPFLTRQILEEQPTLFYNSIAA